jgi:hypothetical protein
MNMHLKALDGVTSAHQDASVDQRASPFVIYHHQLTISKQITMSGIKKPPRC